jgi:hypothetical protein
MLSDAGLGVRSVKDVTKPSVSESEIEIEVVVKTRLRMRKRGGEVDRDDYGEGRRGRGDRQGVSDQSTCIHR